MTSFGRGADMGRRFGLSRKAVDIQHEDINAFEETCGAEGQTVWACEKATCYGPGAGPAFGDQRSGALKRTSSLRCASDCFSPNGVECAEPVSAFPVPLSSFSSNARLAPVGVSLPK